MLWIFTVTRPLTQGSRAKSEGATSLLTLLASMLLYSFQQRVHRSKHKNIICTVNCSLSCTKLASY